MANNNNRKAVPQARAALDQFKYEVANEIGVPLKQGYNGDLTSAQNGYVGGYMVKKMIERQEQQMSGQSGQAGMTNQAGAQGNMTNQAGQ